MAQTLYTSLGQPASVGTVDPARTEYTADDRETVDNDRALFGLYSELGFGVSGLEGDVGRTEVTRADAETVDRDRQAPYESSALFGDGDDLYCKLAENPSAGAADFGRTSLTESTESLDWDRPPIGPWT